MKQEKKEVKKAGAKHAMVMACLIALLVIMSFTLPTPVLENEDGTWHIIWKGNFAQAAENDPGGGASGWLASFCLDYASTPTTALINNATNGSYDGWGNVSGYINTDNTNSDLVSEDPFYFVVRARFNQTHCWNGSAYHDIRCSIRLTVSGDETISDVEGNRTVSQNVSGYDYIWINFWWEDGVDGYRMTDDGAMACNITISAKY